MISYKNFIGAGLMALSGFLFFVWALPYYDGISVLNTAVKQRQDLLAGRSVIIDHVKELNKQYQQESSGINQLSSIVPSKKSLAEVVSAIENITSKNGVQLVSSNVSDHKNEDPNTPYNTLTVEMGLGGSYASLVSFLQSLEKSIRLLDVFSINAETGFAGTLNFKVTANAYYLK